MNHIETMFGGETFDYKDQIFVSTSDFKKNGSRLCVNLKDGSMKWLEPSTLVTKNPIYLIDKDNEIIPIRITEKNE